MTFTKNIQESSALFLIHYNSESHAFNRELIRQYCYKHNLSLIEISWQPSLNQSGIVKYITCLVRILINLYINFSYAKYTNNHLRVIDYIRIIYNIFFKYLKAIFLNDKEYFIKSNISAIITEKHILAWRTALELGIDYAVFLEDDAIPKRLFTSEINELISDRGNCTSIDLAGGFDLKNFHKKESQRLSSNVVVYEKLITNTACAYLMNYPLIEKLCAIKLNQIFNYHGPIDFCLNSYGKAISNENLIISYHFIDPPFEHGSMTGKLNSWQK